MANLLTVQNRRYLSNYFSWQIFDFWKISNIWFIYPIEQNLLILVIFVHGNEFEVNSGKPASEYFHKSTWNNLHDPHQLRLSPGDKKEAFQSGQDVLSYNFQAK